MAEELKSYYQSIDTLKKGCKGMSGDDFAKEIFTKAFIMGKEAGFKAGYNKAVSDSESFELDDGALDEESINPIIEQSMDWDSCDELLNC